MLTTIVPISFRNIEGNWPPLRPTPPKEILSRKANLEVLFKHLLRIYGSLVNQCLEVGESSWAFKLLAYPRPGDTLQSVWNISCKQWPPSEDPGQCSALVSDKVRHFFCFWTHLLAFILLHTLVFHVCFWPLCQWQFRICFSGPLSLTLISCPYWGWRQRAPRNFYF